MDVRADQRILLYDGVCALCNGTVKFMLKRDPTDRYRFAALQSELGRALVLKHGGDPDELSSLVLIVDPGTSNERAIVKGRAALAAITSAGGPWKLLNIFAIFPTFLLNAGYWCIARTRYKLFGKYDTCPIPAAEHRHKFIAA